MVKILILSSDKFILTLNIIYHEISSYSFIYAFDGV